MKLLLLGIDGLRPDCLLFSNTPTIKYLLLHGSYTFDSNIISTTLSGPSWGCILSGKTENITKIFSNSIAEDDNYKWKCDNIFSVLNSMNVNTTSLVSHWEGMANLVQDSNNKIYEKNKSFTECDEIIIQKTIKKIKELNNSGNEFVFTYIVGVDETAHDYGFSIKTKEYIQYIEKIDLLLKPLIKICKDTDWNIIITTDHGGCNYDELEETQRNGFATSNYNMYIGVHGLNIPQHTRVFQIYYGNAFKKIFGNKEILTKRSNADIYTDVINVFKL
uniref:Type I phosphodiesterase / nucleotide pyrophosphatase n=1 Tax=Mimivirus LCMiAC01 TaxID=2506608 RepID=A0A481Z0X3_9VIRU|nr:MAG: type I phosphodiesterase / nucleotide pyrophosphatase [Mimivirus LCMiAC01]